MTSLRRLLLTRPALALWLVVVALAVKALVPAGFMVGTVEGRTVLQMCSGFGPVTVMPAAHHAMAGHATGQHDPAGHGGHDRGDHVGADMPCPYAALTLGTLAAAAPLLLALALAFVLALGVAARALPPARILSYLRPPLRGPPVRA